MFALSTGGGPGLGKTQLGCGASAGRSVLRRTDTDAARVCESSSIQLAVSVQLPVEFGGLAGEAIYIGAYI